MSNKIEEINYSQLSLPDKTNYIFEMLQFDSEQCKVISIDELKITAPVIIVKIFEKILGVGLDNNINDTAFESNAQTVLRILQSKYGLNPHITPPMIIRGDVPVIEQIMDIFYHLALKTNNLNNKLTTQISNNNYSPSKISCNNNSEEYNLQRRVFTISTRFSSTFASSSSITTQVVETPISPATISTNTNRLFITKSQSLNLGERKNISLEEDDVWVSSRDRAEIEKKQREEEEKQKKALEKRLKQQQKIEKQIERQLKLNEKIKSENNTYLSSVNKAGHDGNDDGDEQSQDEDDGGCRGAGEDDTQWRGWRDNGRRSRTLNLFDSLSQQQQDPHDVKSDKNTKKVTEEVYTYDTYSGYRVNPRLLEVLIQRNNPEFNDEDNNENTCRSDNAGNSKSQVFGRSSKNDKVLTKCQSAPNVQKVGIYHIITSGNTPNTKAKTLHSPPKSSFFKASSSTSKKKQLDRTGFFGIAEDLSCYKSMGPLDLLITVEHSYREKNGNKFTKKKDIETSRSHCEAADNIFNFIVNLTLAEYKPRARLRASRINAQKHRKQSDVINMQYANALEVQIAYKNERGVLSSHLLFSKLRSHQWPSLSVLEKRIRAFYSRLNIQLHGTRDSVESKANNKELYLQCNNSYIKLSKRVYRNDNGDLLESKIYDIWDARDHFQASDSVEEEWQGQREDGECEGDATVLLSGSKLTGVP